VTDSINLWIAGRFAELGKGEGKKKFIVQGKAEFPDKRPAGNTVPEKEHSE